MPRFRMTTLVVVICLALQVVFGGSSDNKKEDSNSNEAPNTLTTTDTDSPSDIPTKPLPSNPSTNHPTGISSGNALETVKFKFHDFVRTLQNRLEDDCKKDVNDMLMTLGKKKFEQLRKSSSGDFAATDFNDVYKLSMVGAFQDVERIQKFKNMKVTFSLNIRKDAEVKLVDLIQSSQGNKKYVGKEDAKDILKKWAVDVYNLKNRKHNRKLILGIKQNLHAAVKTVCKDGVENGIGKHDMSHVDLMAHVQVQGEDKFRKGIKIEDENWINGILNTRNVEKFVITATGKWSKVTWFETSLMQVTTMALGKAMEKHRNNWDEYEYYVKAFTKMCASVNKINENGLTNPSSHPVGVSFFSGRRAPSPFFHLLQHLYIYKHLTNEPLGTSSMFAHRVFKQHGFIDNDGKWSKRSGLSDKKEFKLIGTHAHEAQMVFQAMYKDLDEKYQYPMSAVLWHMKYWHMTNNFGALPDTVGSRSLKMLFSRIDFPESYMNSLLHESNIRDKANQNKTKAMTDLRGKKIIECMKKTNDAAGLVRQDSGDLKCFVGTDEIYGAFDGKEFKSMASEIGSDDDVVEAANLRFIGFGIGGYFGEKPYPAFGNDTGKLDMVAKVSQVQIGKQIFRPVKLGDYSGEGKEGCALWWGDTLPGKFSFDPLVTDKKTIDASYQTFRRYGYVPYFHPPTDVPEHHPNFVKKYAVARGSLEVVNDLDTIWKEDFMELSMRY